MIGVAGGAGPLAGIDLCKKITEETAASGDQEHLPLILLSLPGDIPDRTEYLLGKESRNPASAIGAIFMQLEKAGATVAAIPCNTAHAPVIFDKVTDHLKKSNSRLVVLNMIHETIRYLKMVNEHAVIGILSTTGTKAAGIYSNPLREHGFSIIEPDEELQTQIHQAIYNTEYGIKSHASPVSGRAREALLHAADELISRGAAILLLACSELPLAIPERSVRQKRVIDPTRILARAMIAAYAPAKLKADKPG